MFGNDEQCLEMTNKQNSMPNWNGNGFGQTCIKLDGMAMVFYGFNHWPNDPMVTNHNKCEVQFYLWFV